MIDFHNGSLIIGKENEIPYVFDDLVGTAEVHMSADEVAPIKFDLHKEASFFCESVDLNMELFEQQLGKISDVKNFTLYYDRPIMIQARWHKKARINKKWLKSYGMKRDVVKCASNGRLLDYTPAGDGFDGVYGANSFEFETDVMTHILRPDQMRRGLKIEW